MGATLLYADRMRYALRMREGDMNIAQVHWWLDVGTPKVLFDEVCAKGNQSGMKSERQSETLMEG